MTLENPLMITGVNLEVALTAFTPSEEFNTLILTRWK